MPLRNFTCGGGKEKINSAVDIEVRAANQISIGDTVYTVQGEDSQFISLLSSYVYSAAFSPDGTKLVLGGSFSGRAKLYSVSGTAITFVSDIYADTGTTALSSTVYSAIFSPDGTKLVLGGSFSGRAKIYSVSGTAVTFVSNIYADTGTTALSDYVYSATFSSDGAKLTLVGNFSGDAKIYSVSGTAVTFVSNIYADTGTTALSSTVYSAAFSPDGTKLVLGGVFSGFAKLYSVSGTAITFVSDIYADASTTALSNTVKSAAFSPDGTKLVVGGYFPNYCKIYVSPFNHPIIYGLLQYAYSSQNVPNSAKYIGYSKNLISKDSSGIVRIIADLLH